MSADTKQQNASQHLHFCCKVEHFNVRVCGVDALWGPASCGHQRNCSLWRADFRCLNIKRLICIILTLSAALTCLCSGSYCAIVLTHNPLCSLAGGVWINTIWEEASCQHYSDYYPFSGSSSHTRSCHSSSPQLSTFASLGCIICELHKSVCRSRPRSGFLPFRGNLSFLCSHWLFTLMLSSLSIVSCCLAAVSRLSLPPVHVEQFLVCGFDPRSCSRRVPRSGPRPRLLLFHSLLQLTAFH